MNLRETKVIVIDDKREDVVNLLKLLDKEGVPYNYYYEDANIDNLPQNPLINVRLIFLDFVLGTDGQPIKTKLAALLNVLKRILHPNNGPYIILAWTVHNSAALGDLITPFKSELLINTDIPKPVAIADLDKISVMQNLKQIDRKLKRTFDGGNIFEILLDWECNGRTALADVIKTLTDLSAQQMTKTATSLDEYSTLLRKAAEKNMCRFASSLSGEKNLKPGKSILIDAQLPLGNIFQDHLETYIRKLKPKFRLLSRKIYGARNTPKYTAPEKAQMNTYFLLVSDPDSSIKPGNIYKANSVLRKVDRSGKITLWKKDFYDKNMIKKSKTVPDVDARIKELNKIIIPILIEVTPECDYTQKNWRGAKFIFGILWPPRFARDNRDEYLQKADKIFPPLLIKYKGEVYFLTFHANYQIMLPLSAVRSIKPILRARKELLVDVQHWSATHASRPGKTEF
jgi:hypothetical protein